MNDFELVDSKDLIRELLRVCPEFEPCWLEYQKDWEGTGLGEPTIAFVRFLVQSQRKGETSYFPKVFGFFETMLEAENVRYSHEQTIKIYILEALREECQKATLDPDVFSSYYGTRLLGLWNGLSDT